MNCTKGDVPGTVPLLYPYQEHPGDSMVTIKRTLAGAVAAAGAAATLVAAAAPAHAAYYSLCNASPNPVDVCINNQQHVTTLLAVPDVTTSTVPVASVAAWIYVYRVPNASVGVPCVVAAVNTTTNDQCANLGL